MVVIYRTPKDVEAFDRHYFEIHVPLAKKLPGLRKYEISDGPIATPVGAPDVYRIGTLYFDDLAALEKAFASPEEKRPGPIAGFTRPMTRASRCSFSTTGTFEPTPLLVSAGARGKLAGGRPYRS
ncbi:EthD family reductase [Mesorhizobium sp. ORM6]